jgi:hypothetical protein
MKEVIGFYEICYENLAPRGHTKVVLLFSANGKKMTVTRPGKVTV